MMQDSILENAMDVSMQAPVRVDPDALRDKPVQQLQTFLREIARFYPEIPAIIPDNIFGPETTQSVYAFQAKFNLPANGEVDQATWDAIYNVYVTIAHSMSAPRSIAPFVNAGVEIGEEGEEDKIYLVQVMLRHLGRQYVNLTVLAVSGRYDAATREAVCRFQQLSRLPVTGMVDKATWDEITDLYNASRCNPTQ